MTTEKKIGRRPRQKTLEEASIAELTERRAEAIARRDTASNDVAAIDNELEKRINQAQAALDPQRGSAPTATGPED